MPIFEGLVEPAAEKSTLFACVLRWILGCALAMLAISAKIIRGQTPGFARSASRRDTCPCPSEPRPVGSKNVDFIGFECFRERLRSAVAANPLFSQDAISRSLASLSLFAASPSNQKEDFFQTPVNGLLASSQKLAFLTWRRYRRTAGSPNASTTTYPIACDTNAYASAASREIPNGPRIVTATVWYVPT